MKADSKMPDGKGSRRHGLTSNGSDARWDVMLRSESDSLDIP